MTLYEVFEDYNNRSDLLHFVEELNKPEYQVTKNSVNVIASLILGIMHRHFSDNANLERRAFELFGQGTLYDMNVNATGQPRRPPEYRIHKMDGSTPSYREFSRFVRIAQLLGLPSRTNYNSQRWLQIDRYIGLAAEIDLLMNPAQSIDGTNPGNSSISDVDLTNFQNKWLALSFEQVDAELAVINV